MIGRGRGCRIEIFGRRFGEEKAEQARAENHQCPKCGHRYITGGLEAGGVATWPALASEHLVAGGIVAPEHASTFSAILACAVEVTTVEDLAAKLGTSRRQLTRRLEAAKAPTSRQLLGLARGLAAAERVIDRGASAREAAEAVSFGDSFTLLKAWKRDFGITTAELRGAPDPVWRWLTERWLEGCGKTTDVVPS